MGLALATSGCETMRISGTLSYVDPDSGAKAGLTVVDNKGGWWVKIPGPKQPDGTPGGVFVLEGDLPKVDTKSGK